MPSCEGKETGLNLGMAASVRSGTLNRFNQLPDSLKGLGLQRNGGDKKRKGDDGEACHAILRVGTVRPLCDRDSLTTGY